MYAAVLHALGGAPRYEQVSDPVPSTDEVLVRVSAAALKPVDKQMASGSHYASPRELPVVCGVDGVGRLESGARVFFAGPRPPNGAMAERTVMHKARCWPIPDGIDDFVVAAVVNPGMSAWLSLAWRAKLVQGESVLILGATGTTGKLAIQIAKLLGADRIIAAGRDAQTLRALPGLGADATIRLGARVQDFAESLVREASDKGFDVILDYLWGAPTEALLAAITRPSFTATQSGRMRLIQVGESAGPTISLPAAALRSSALEILGAGSGAIPPLDFIRKTYNELLERTGKGELRIDTERVPLANVEAVWQRQEQPRRRIVFVPEGVA